MARFAVALKVGLTTPGSESAAAIGSVTDPINAAATAADKTAFEAALATLVADGASPTQAHVTAANSAYTTFKADLALPPTNVDVIVSYDAAVVVTRSVLRHMLLAALRAVESGNSLTA